MKKLAIPLLILALVPIVLNAQDDPGFVIIVNAQNPVTELSAKDIDRMFLKKTSRWEDGERIVPVDQENDSEVREMFSRAIFNKGINPIESYWQRQIFSGRNTPPDKLVDDAAVIAFVAANRGAIGYVGSAAELTDAVKALTIDYEDKKK